MIFMNDVLDKIGDIKTCTSAIIVKNGKILLGLRHYAKQNTDHDWKTISVWTTPGGRCDKGEKIKENLLRETEEETGIKNIQIEKFLGKADGAKEGDEVFVFLCTTEEEAVLTELEKFSEWRWFSPEEIPPNFINENILKIIKKSLV